MPYAAGLSEHPFAAHAVGEVAGQVLDAIGSHPDLAVLFVTAPHVGALEDMVPAIRALVQPRTLLGATAVSVLGGRHEVEEKPAVSLWAARFGGDAVPVRFTVDHTDDGLALRGLDEHDAELAAARSLLLIPDPYTFPVDLLIATLASRHPHLAVIGGLASAARGPGGNRLVLDGEITTHGAVGVLLAEEVAPRTVVSQGCRPIGQPWTVTRSDGNFLLEIGGRPALERLMALIDALPPDDRTLAARGLHCGIVVDESKVDFERGDFLIRGVLGADRARGAIAVGDVVPVGATVQFQVRDAASADEDLHQLLLDARADAALVFTCNGRGTNLFDGPDHDASVVADVLDTSAVAGMFCAGEIGPVAGRNALHGFTASVALFSDPL